MFQKIKATIARDRDYPERQYSNQVLTAVLKGKFYDNLKHAFCEEATELGEHIPLVQRRPSVQTNLAKVVVDDSVSMLFSEGHFPKVHCEDEMTRDTLAALVKEARLNEKMIEAATVGSVGSVAIRMRVLNRRVFFDVMNTQFLTPFYDPMAPDTLLKVREQYKVKGSSLIAAGFKVKEPGSMYWFVREWDKSSEIYMKPYLVSDKEAVEKVDESKTVKHDLGFVPIEWVRNLPGGDGVDGACTFEAAIPTIIEMDYQMSQAGRGLRYSSDPMIVIKEPEQAGGEIVKGGGHALIVGEGGDAKLLEINGKAATAVVDYVKALREFALESIHGNRANAEKMGAATSGKAMELMNQSLVWLADKLRISYGEGALLNLFKMVVKASQIFDLQINDKPVGKLSDDALTLRWPAWYENTASDRQAESVALMNLVDSKVMSTESAISSIAAEYDIEDIPAELARIQKEKDDAAHKEALLAAASRPTPPSFIQPGQKAS